MFNGEYDFPSRVSFFKITESFSRVAQRVTPIDDGYNFSRCKKIFQKNQILLVDIRDKEARFLAPNPRQ
jgi:hypothetical protein